MRSAKRGVCREQGAVAPARSRSSHPRQDRRIGKRPEHPRGGRNGGTHHRHATPARRPLRHGRRVQVVSQEELHDIAQQRYARGRVSEHGRKAGVEEPVRRHQRMDCAAAEHERSRLAPQVVAALAKAERATRKGPVKVEFDLVRPTREYLLARPRVGRRVRPLVVDALARLMRRIE